VRKTFSTSFVPEPTENHSCEFLGKKIVLAEAARAISAF